MQAKIDLSELFKSDNEFLKSLNKISKEIKKYAKFQGHLFDSPEMLYEFLVFDTSFSKELERIYIYAHINNDLDLSNNTYQDYLGRVMNIMNEVSEVSSFVVPEILEHDYSEFKEMIKKYPLLKEYNINIKNIFRNKKFIKSKEEEKLISILTSSYNKPEDISEMLINTDLDYGIIKDENGKDIHLTNSNYSTYLESSNRDVRKSAFKAMYNEIKAHENTFGSILATEVLNNNKLAKIRNFKSAREYSLYQNDVKNNIYDELIEGVHRSLPIFNKYYEFKQQILGLEDFHLYDTYANIVKEFDKKYSFEEAKDIILNATSILGKNYFEDLKRAFDENWIDSTILKTKRSGAYCTCAYVTHPYVVMSYEEKLNDISTLAHELGHAMHYYYAQKNNSYQDYGYSIFVAEVASQVNEIILTDYLLKNTTDKEEKKYLLDLILQRFKSTIIRQTMFAEFEDKLHNLEKEGNTLTKDLITSEYYELNKSYFGKNVTIDEDIKYECFRIPHFYYNFYVYQYATGYAAALKIASDIINGKENCLENYLKFLRLGSTKDPVSSLKVAGIDMTDSKIYEDVFKVFEERLNELRSLYE
ncbi:MAG: oligoendopeptidase F [Firmicutes bacterium]|nr:oligoendopeptidase F [Bacillota bacterium]